MSSASNSYDAVVIGAGPAGSTAATLVAMAGHRVLQLERESFPRFKVGESLIPATNDVLDRLGMLDQLREGRFVEKHSVQFFAGDGRAGQPFYFRETDPSSRSQTWQVLRSEFDQMLLDNGRRHGVEAHDGVTVKQVRFDEADRAVGVEAKFADGETRQIDARVVIDASGQRALIARKLGLRVQDECLRMASIFTHFEGGQRDPGIDEGATLICHTEGSKSWLWYIPMPDNMVSVGVVGPIPHLIQGRQGDPQKVLDEEIARCPGVKPRLEGARQALEVKVLNDFSYVSRQLAGDGWVLAGDAFGFLDPMYSTGVLLALKSGEMAGDAVATALDAEDTSAARLATFESKLRGGLSAFRRLVFAFYSPEFSFGKFLKRHPEHRAGVVDILVGDVFERDFERFFTDLEQMLSPATAKLSAAEAAQGVA
nr:1H-pyrrole-2-carbonyl-[peptidyl-carrier protein] chlorinase-like [Nerophis lumbriciformis]